MANHTPEASTTRTLYAELWGHPPYNAITLQVHREALGGALLYLAAAFDRSLTETSARAYLASLSQLTPEQAITAFSRAQDELRFFPVPSVLLELGSLAKKAKRNGIALLAFIFEAFRLHGCELKAIGAKVLKSTNDDGSFLPREKWEWNEVIPAPTFTPVVERALLTVGRGDRDAGIAMLSCHPGLPWNRQRGQEEAPSASFQQRDRAQIENEWCDAIDEAQATLGVK